MKAHDTGAVHREGRIEHERVHMHVEIECPTEPLHDADSVPRPCATPPQRARPRSQRAPRGRSAKFEMLKDVTGTLARQPAFLSFRRQAMDGQTEEATWRPEAFRSRGRAL